MSEWVSIEDNVPAVESGEMFSELVSVKCDDGLVYETKYSRVTGFRDYSITHWMPLPEVTP